MMKADLIKINWLNDAWLNYLYSLNYREKQFDEFGEQYTSECNICGTIFNNPDDCYLPECFNCCRDKKLKSLQIQLILFNE